VLALLAFSVFIAFVDRGNLSIAAPLLKDELHSSASQLGILLSAFFWSSSLFVLLVGSFIDRFNVSWILAGGFFLWSLATTFTGFVHGFAALLVMRLVLGIGESVAYPAYGNIFARHFPEHYRGIANGVIGASQACGPAFATYAGGMIIGDSAGGPSSFCWASQLSPGCLFGFVGVPARFRFLRQNRHALLPGCCKS
jgi:MFS family permease